jgi:hypothetical protein
VVTATLTVSDIAAGPMPRARVVAGLRFVDSRSCARSSTGSSIRLIVATFAWIHSRRAIASGAGRGRLGVSPV